MELNHKLKTGRVVFLHVPADLSPDAIKHGADIAAAYIAALVDGVPTSSEASPSESDHVRMRVL